MRFLADIIEPPFRWTFLTARRFLAWARLEWDGLVREFWESK